MTVSVGIDFGTSTTLIAVRQDGLLPEVIAIGENTSWMPSVVGLTDSGELVIGEAAELTTDPFRSVKSVITNDDSERAKAFGLSPKELIEKILYEAMSRAAAARREINEAVDYFVGCPAGWDGNQRRAISDVASSLGIDVDIAEVIDEPVAAGLSWVESKWFSGDSKPTGRALVFDAGGGTLDVAVMEIEETERGNNRIVVLAAGSLAKSGDAVDASIAKYIAKQNGFDADSFSPDVALLKDARDIKEALANNESVTNNNIFIDSQRYSITITQEILNEIIQEQLSQSLTLVELQLRLAELRGSNAVGPQELSKLDLDVLCKKINHVVLVGGLTKLSVFADALRLMFPTAATHEVGNPQELVAMGLTFGERLQSLNLPRPPVNFVVESGEEREVLYQAFTPLYKTINPMYNELYVQKHFPGFVERGTPLVICQSPTRDHRRLQMVIAVKHDAGTNAPDWWTQYEGSDWKKIDKDELPSALDFVAEIDHRTGDVVYDEPNFIDATSYVNRHIDKDSFEITFFVGTALFLKNCATSGFIKINVDGSVVLHTRGGSEPGKHELKMKVLFWPLKSEEREVNYQKGRFAGRPAIEDKKSIDDNDEASEIDVAPILQDETQFEDVEILLGNGESEEADTCLEFFVAELARIRGIYEDDARSNLLAVGHFGISLIMSDYDMTDEDISDEINEASSNQWPEVFMVTEDDVPKIVLFRLVSGVLAKQDQRRHLTDMTYQMDLLRQRTSVRGLTDTVMRARFADIKRVRRLDPEVHFHLITPDTPSDDLIDVGLLEFDGVRRGVDQVAIHDNDSLINLYCDGQTPRKSTAMFTIDADKYFAFEGNSGNRLVQVLMPAEEYVKGTYPIGVDLFRLNPRLFLSKAAGPNKAMKETLESTESELFHLLNNGITGVCESLQVEVVGGQVKVTAVNLQIVNGCQTTETIWAWARKAADRSRVMVPLRLVQAGSDEVLSRRISMTTNSQSAIAAADLVANDEIQKRVKSALHDFGIFYESRRGEWRKLSIGDRNKLKKHSYDWASDEILKINLRELGQAMLSVTGKPNQAKEQIAGLFKEQNRSTYKEVFGESWDDPSQISIVALLYIYLKDVDNWIPATATKEYRTLAGLGRFYVMYLLYEYWRKTDRAFVGPASQRAEGQEFLVDDEYSSDWIKSFDPEEINQIANLAVKALAYVLKTSNGAIDGNRALLRQSVHKVAIEDRFRTLLDAAGL
jgi:actin-like ATPase involved in cell morphogenesis